MAKREGYVRMLNVYIDYNEKINYTTELNGISLIRNIKIENDSDEDFESLYLEVVFQSEIMEKKYVKEFNLSKDTYYNVDISDDLNINLAYLSMIEETGQHKFEINIIKESEIIFEKEYKFDILPYNHWLGVSVHPDLIASFIAPNNKHISRIVKDAAQIARINNFSMSAYQSGLQRNVRNQINSIFESIKKLEINYVSVPPSFEEIGQKVRSIDEIIENKIANCLDIAVLAASSLEAVGLNPFIIIVKGHAFVGAWLEDKTYSDSVIEDRAFFLKRLATGVREVELFESVLLTSNDRYTYETALTEAEDKIEIADNFIMGIDIKQARSMMIKPLPKMRDLTIDQTVEVTEESESKIKINEVEYEIDDIELTDKSARDKMQLWESKLLDLTLRNNLLNFIPYTRNISLVESDLGILEDKLSTGTEFSVLSAPAFIQTENKKEKVFSYTRKAITKYLNYMNNEISNNRLASLHSEIELDRSLKLLYRESRTSIQENGSNSLFLAMGFLKWFETDLSEVPRFSPIILYPIEIVRKGGGSGYKIRFSDEEIQINTTLLEKIRNDLEIEIPGLNPLPRDEKGIDVSYILNTMRTAVKDKSRWDVVEWSYIGIFLFNQFVMWEDIRTRKNDILENNNIKRILGEGQSEIKSMIDEETTSLFLMPADSSQALAVNHSLKGEDFVLYGPPGTGKSQTITNIIASSLYNGKTVLFVAEKMAALEVVQDRLHSIGLSDFSLELHSNKSKKTEVLNRIGKTLEIDKRGEIVGFNENLEKYEMTRKEAKDILLLVNSKQENNMSLYDMINLYAQTIEEEQIKVEESVYQKFSQATIEILFEKVEEIKLKAGLLGKIKDHNLMSIKVPILKMKDKDTLKDLINECTELISEIIEQSANLNEVEYILGSSEESDAILLLLENAVSEKVYFEDYLQKKDNRIFDSIISNLIELNHEKLSELSKIEEIFEETVFDENVELIEQEWQSSQLTWFLPKLLKQSAILKVLNKHTSVTKITNQEVSSQLNRINKFNEINQNIDKILEEHGSLFWEAKTGSIFDLKKLEQMYGNTRKYKEVANRVILINKYINEEVFVKDFVKGREKYLLNKDQILNVIRTRESLIDKLTDFENLSESIMIKNDSKTWLESTRSEFKKMKSSLNDLDLWLDYNKSKLSLVKEGYHDFVDAYEANNGNYNLYETIIKNVSYSYIIDLIDSDEKFFGFSSTGSNIKLDQINDLKNKMNKILEADLYERLARNLPDNNFNANPNSEIGLLKKAVGNGGRGISLRELFSKAPNALRKVAPCMLMSPISVAQYISPDNHKFDLIIFDEASQVETHKAIGAISRGTQVIVVGDPKQLPPTSFFKSGVEDESFEESDLPSILDELISLSFPGYYLKWHYRSNHESLITFSNQTYYDDGLFTFPSVNNKDKKVRNINVNGTFGTPKSGQNLKEAEEIVSYLKKLLLKDKDFTRSIGVVTFNQPQRALILDMIDEEMTKNSEFSKAIGLLREEFFVKNIENVQGDERDLIIFSIGFGPKEDGKMSMNFGPINQKGGSKRLNVAVTRARDEMLLFSSFSASKIDLNRTSKKGPKDLKSFLEYAQTDLKMQADYSDSDLSKSGILVQLKKDLEERGYKSEINLGTSGFKIDLAIEDIKNPDEYLAALMIDGGFTKSDSLDDRVSTQTIMLQRLGWKIVNLWTVDWFKNKELSIDMIIKNIEEINEGQDENNENHDVINEDHSKELDPIIEFATIDNDEFFEYKSAVTEEFLADIRSVTVDEFYEYSRLRQLASLILKEVVETESPILFDTLCRRVMQKFDLSVLTDKMRSHFSSIIKIAGVHHDIDDTVWENFESKEKFRSFRIPGERRDFLDIPKCEVRNAIIFTLRNQLSLTEEEIHREVFNVFGFNMLGKKAKTHLSSIIVDMNLKSIHKQGDLYNVIESE